MMREGPSETVTNNVAGRRSHRDADFVHHIPCTDPASCLSIVGGTDTSSEYQEMLGICGGPAP